MVQLCDLFLGTKGKVAFVLTLLASLILVHLLLRRLILDPLGKLELAMLRVHVDLRTGRPLGQVQTFSGSTDLIDNLFSVRERMFLHVLALPAVVVEQQIRILWQQRQGFAQLLQTFGEASQIAPMHPGSSRKGTNSDPAPASA